MGAADQDVAGDPVKYDVGRKIEAAAGFVDLGREGLAQLGIVGLEVAAYLLPRLLEADGAVGPGDLVLAVRQDQYVFVNLGHEVPGATSACRGLRRRRPSHDRFWGGLR